MTSEDHNLSPEQRELVAVGASVGAGCSMDDHVRGRLGRT
jgi:hypothetical protein